MVVISGSTKRVIDRFCPLSCLQSSIAAEKHTNRLEILLELFRYLHILTLVKPLHFDTYKRTCGKIIERF